MSEIVIVGIAGSLRKGSLNRMLIENSARLAPAGMRIEAFPLNDVPVYDMDLEGSFPESVTRLKEVVKAAHGVLFAVPEHNYSYSGVLKNAIDWGSRPYGDGCWDRKPVILQSASPGWAGGMRAQYHLRQVLNYFEMRQMYFPEVFVGGAHKKFDKAGALTDEFAADAIRKQLEAFAEFVRNP